MNYEIDKADPRLLIIRYSNKIAMNKELCKISERYEGLGNAADSKIFNGILRYSQYYFLNYIIQVLDPNSANTTYTYYEHDLTIDTLFAIKHFQSSNIENGLSLNKTHPEYFKKSYSELDEKKEYIELEKLMGELKILIDDNKQKKEYYESLEKRNSELEVEVKQLQNKATEINEIKSLLKDQQEYAHIIQSLLKKINKLENKAIEN